MVSYAAEDIRHAVHCRKIELRRLGILKMSLLLFLDPFGAILHTLINQLTLQLVKVWDMLMLTIKTTSQSLLTVLENSFLRTRGKMLCAFG